MALSLIPFSSLEILTAQSEYKFGVFRLGIDNMTCTCELIATQEGICIGSTSRLKICKNYKSISSIFAISKKIKVFILGGKNLLFSPPRDSKKRRKGGSSVATQLNMNKSPAKAQES